MNGFLNIYKPKGMSSFDVIRFLRKQIGIKKMGHIGTLDPAAEGVLVVALEQATKLIEFMMDHDKKYEAEITLGKKSNTYDSEGEIIKVSSQKPKEEEIEKIVKTFVGEIDQAPPIFSALKIDGERAYKRARAGEKIEMKKRKVVVNSIEIIEYKYPILKLNIHCGKGTYIRSIAHDIGEELEVGAYLSFLKRTAIDTFIVEKSHTLEDIEENGIEDYLLPIRRGASGLSQMVVTHLEYEVLKNGGFVKKEMPKDVAICAAIFNNDLVGIIEKAKEKNSIKFKKQFI
jgi:tRNA pseudouridine55 synthase